MGSSLFVFDPAGPGHSCKVRHGISVLWLKYLFPKVLKGLLVISLALREGGGVRINGLSNLPLGPG